METQRYSGERRKRRPGDTCRALALEARQVALATGGVRGLAVWLEVAEAYDAAAFWPALRARAASLAFRADLWIG